MGDLSQAYSTLHDLDELNAIRESAGLPPLPRGGAPTAGEPRALEQMGSMLAHPFTPAPGLEKVEQAIRGAPRTPESEASFTQDVLVKSGREFAAGAVPTTTAEAVTFGLIGPVLKQIIKWFPVLGKPLGQLLKKPTPVTPQEIKAAAEPAGMKLDDPEADELARYINQSKSAATGALVERPVAAGPEPTVAELAKAAQPVTEPPAQGPALGRPEVMGLYEKPPVPTLTEEIPTAEGLASKPRMYGEKYGAQIYKEPFLRTAEERVAAGEAPSVAKPGFPSAPMHGEPAPTTLEPQRRFLDHPGLADFNEEFRKEFFKDLPNPDAAMRDPEQFIAMVRPPVAKAHQPISETAPPVTPEGAAPAAPPTEPVAKAPKAFTKIVTVGGQKFKVEANPLTPSKPVSTTEALATIGIDNPETVVAVSDRLGKLVAEERTAQGSHIVLPNAVAEVLGRDLNLTEQAVLTSPEFEPMSPWFYARRDLAHSAFEKAMAEYTDPRGSDDLLKLHFSQFIGLQANTENLLEEGARLLQTGRDNLFKWMKDARAMALREQELHEAMHPDVPFSGAQIRALIRSQGFQKAVKDVQAGKHYGWDMWSSFLFGNAFSNVPKTAGTNYFNSFFNALIQVPIRELGAIKDRVLGPTPLSADALKAGTRAQLVTGEGFQSLYGVSRGFAESVKAIKQSWDGGGVRGLVNDFLNAKPLEAKAGKLDQPATATPAISTENLKAMLLQHKASTQAELDPNGLVKPLIDFLDSATFAGKTVRAAINVPGQIAHGITQALEVGDLSGYLMLDRQARAAEAYGRAVLSGLNEEQTAAFIEHELTTPTDIIARTARTSALHDLYRQPIEPGMTRGAQIALQQHPTLRLVQLILRTPFNIQRSAMESLPVINRMLTSVRADYAAGGTRASLATGRMLFGSAVVGAVYAPLAFSDRITGHGPANPELRKEWLATHDPNSIGIYRDADGHTLWVPNQVLGAHGILMSLTADITQMASWAKATPDSLDTTFWDKAEQALYYPVVSIAYDSVNTIWTEGLIRLIDALTPESTETERGWSRRLEHYLERSASLLIPLHSLVKDMNVEVNTLLDDLKASVPGWSKDLEQKVDWYGDVDHRGMLNTLNPFGGKTTTNQYLAVDREMQENAPHLLSIPRWVENQELTGNEETRFIKIRGQDIRLDGRTMGPALQHLIHSPEYLTATRGMNSMRSNYLAQTVNYFTHAAIATMAEQDPNYLNLKDQLDKASRLTGQPIIHPFTHRPVGVGIGAE